MAFAAIFIDADTFRIAGDYTANFVVGRKVRANCGVDGYRFGYVSASSFAAGNTDVDLDQIVDDAGNDDVLTANLATVEWSVVGVGPTGNQYVPREIDIERYISFSDAIDSIGGDDRTLVISASYPAAVNKTVPWNVTLKINPSGRLAPAAGVTITIAHPIEAGFYQVFAGDGDILFSTTCTVYPEWWGAVGDESADDQPAIQAAINSIGPYFATWAEYEASVHQKGEVLLTNRYRVDSTVELYDGISFRGLNPPSHGGAYHVLGLRPRRAGTQIVSNIQDGSNIIEVIGSAAESLYSGSEAVVWYRGYIGGFTIWGTYGTGIPGNDGHGLALLSEYFAFSVIENLLIRGCGQNGFHVDATCGYYYNTVSNVQTVYCVNHNFHIDGSGLYQTHNYFEHCRSSGGENTHGWYLNEARHITFIECIGEGASEINWYLKDCFQNRFYGCGGEGGTYLRERALELDGSDANIFNGCYFIRSTPIIFTNSSRNTFQACRVYYLAQAITGATQANPCVVTAVGSNVGTGQEMVIAGVNGMTELNGNVYTVTWIDADHFSLDGIDSTGYGAYAGPDDGDVIPAYLLTFDAASDMNVFDVLHVGGQQRAYYEIEDLGVRNRIISLEHSYAMDQPVDYKPINYVFRPELVLNRGFETPGAGGADIWASWNEFVTDGALANETTLIHDGVDAAKITAGPTNDTRIEQPFTVVPYRHYWFAFYTAGDAGVNPGRYGVYDRTNGAWIVPVTSTGITAAAYSLVVVYWTAPALCVSADVRFYCPANNGSIAYFDDASVREN